MLELFEEETSPLTDYELDIVPILARALAKRQGADQAVTNKDIQRVLVQSGYDINGARVRKLINYIRNNYLVLGLIGTSKGYYVSTDEAELRKYIQSLQGREDAIRKVKASMAQHYSRLYKKPVNFTLFD